MTTFAKTATCKASFSWVSYIKKRSSVQRGIMRWECQQFGHKASKCPCRTFPDRRHFNKQIRGQQSKTFPDARRYKRGCLKSESSLWLRSIRPYIQTKGLFVEMASFEPRAVVCGNNETIKSCKREDGKLQWYYMKARKYRSPCWRSPFEICITSLTLQPTSYPVLLCASKDTMSKSTELLDEKRLVVYRDSMQSWELGFTNTAAQKWQCNNNCTTKSCWEVLARQPCARIF